MKKIAFILFFLSLSAPLIAFSLSTYIGETSIFGIGGAIKYSWIFLLFIPIPISSIILAFTLMHKKLKYKKNLIAAFISLPLLIIFSTYRIVYSNMYSYDNSKIIDIEKKINISLPDNVKIVTNTITNLSYVKISNLQNKEIFEENIKKSEFWKNNLEPKINDLLPYDVQYDCLKFNSFIFYNMTTNEYNNPQIEEDSICIFIAYEYKKSRLLVLDNYKVKVT